MSLLPLGCLSSGERIIQRDVPGGDETEPSFIEPGSQRADAAPPPGVDAGLNEPHQLLGADPSHGPFAGGQLVRLRGRGFTNQVRVWFGEHEVEAEQVVAISASSLQVTTPAASAGPVDVITQNGDDRSTRRTLIEGYVYNPFYVVPASGPTTGGNRVTLVAQQGTLAEDAVVRIDRQICELIEQREADGLQEYDCLAPEGTPGAKNVQLEFGELRLDVAGGYTYASAAGAYEGRFSGERLSSQLRVTVRDAMMSEPVPGAVVILDDAFEPELLSRDSEDWGAQVARTDDAGVANFEGDLGPERTVTVAAPCMQPLTLAAVPVSELLVYLEPVLDPSCIPPNFDLPNLGGGRGVPAPPVQRLTGQLTWGPGVEFKRGGWSVPHPVVEEEQRVAYVFELARSPRASFSLPGRSYAVTETTPGDLGYLFEYPTRSRGNLGLYALAGVEVRSAGQRRFTPYVMGYVNGVDASSPDAQIYIPMTIPLDHRIELDVQPPTMTARGPDRVYAQLSLRVGRSGYIVLPQQPHQGLLPLSEPLSWVGVPPLVGPLLDARYVATVSAATGPEGSTPLSVLEARSARSTSEPLPFTDFVAVPRLLEPEASEPWSERELEWEDVTLGGSVDLVVVRLISPGALVTWRVIAPAKLSSLRLPRLGPELGLPRGRVTAVTAAARIRGFDYSTLRERDFGSEGWDAYALDSIEAYLP